MTDLKKPDTSELSGVVEAEHSEPHFEPYTDFDLNFYTQAHFDAFAKALGVEARTAVAFIGLSEEKLAAGFAKEPEMLTEFVESLIETILKMDGLKSVLESAVERIAFVGERWSDENEKPGTEYAAKGGAPCQG